MPKRAENELLVIKTVLNITALIKKYLKDSGITQVYLAEALKESPQNLANKLRKNDLDTDYIRRISIAVGHDFFQDLSRQLQQELGEDVKSRQHMPPALPADGTAGYVNTGQYIRLLEENLQLYRELLKTGKD